MDNFVKQSIMVLGRKNILKLDIRIQVSRSHQFLLHGNHSLVESVSAISGLYFQADGPSYPSG
jgi:hypothetical protein